MREHAVFTNRWLPWVFLAPSLAVLTVFLYYPLWQAVVLSFHRANLLLGTRRFVGWGNYEAIFTGPLSARYHQVMVQSFAFSMLVVVIGLSISVVLATLAAQPLRGARVYRLLLIWPFALSPAVAATIMLFLFNPEIGGVNQVLNALFGIKPRWLDTPQLAFALVVVTAVWKNLGYNVVFYLAALQNVPKELSEAAAIDGASGFQRFFRITLPMLSPMTFFLVFTNLTYSFFDSYGLIDVLTRGGPIGPAPFDAVGITRTMVYQVANDGFTGSGNTGLAAAFGNIVLAIVALITFAQFRFGGRRVQYGDH
ncbi:MAG: sugar ABC transporter permease [Trueperaceae bacterium]|nr:sugar ABC transporter permease [Trueperaceae bacterium]